MKVSKEIIETFIPHRAPFIMVDNVIEATPETIETDFLILPGNIFIDNGILREFALIENIAQSSCLGLAITNKNTDGKTRNGFIGGISRLQVYDLPKINDTIHTVVNILAQLNNLFLVKGVNYVNGKKLLECEMKLAGS